MDLVTMRVVVNAAALMEMFEFWLKQWNLHRSFEALSLNPKQGALVNVLQEEAIYVKPVLIIIQETMMAGHYWNSLPQNTLELYSGKYRADTLSAYEELDNISFVKS